MWIGAKSDFVSANRYCENLQHQIKTIQITQIYNLMSCALDSLLRTSCFAQNDEVVTIRTSYLAMTD